MRDPRGQKRLAALIFAVFLVGAVVLAAASTGLGDPSVPEGDIAVVEEAPDGTITREDFDRALVQTAARQGLKEVPAEDDPQFQQFKDAAVSDLLLARWVLGEAEERGIEISDREIDAELEKVKTQQFGSEKAFEKFLEQSGFTPEEALERIELQLISERIQEDVLPQEPEIADDEIDAYYEENITQFQQPETRDVRVVLAQDEQDATAALEQLGTAPGAKDWEAVAKKYSTDEATKGTGGLREAVVEGQSEPALDEQIFAAPEGELVGPFQTDAGFYVLQVEKITPAETTPLADVEEQIRQTLVSARQQEIATTFQDDFQTKWVSRTFCAEDYATDRCSNAPALPDACQGDDENEQLPVDPVTGKPGEEVQCDAPVPSTKPIAPGTAGVFGAPAAPGLPQGPQTGAEAPTGGLPPGVTIPGGLPPGAAPPATAPPGGAPPGTVPPGG